MQGTSRSELAADLERCARHCEETAAFYVERHGDRAAGNVVSSLLLAAAAMDTAARTVDGDGHGGVTARMIAATLVGDAIAAAERRGYDESLLQCVVGLRRVAERLER